MASETALGPLTAEEEAEVRRLDALFDIDDPTDYARPDWLVDLLVERRRLLVTLDEARKVAQAVVDAADAGAALDPIRSTAIDQQDSLMAIFDAIDALRAVLDSNAVTTSVTTFPTTDTDPPL